MTLFILLIIWILAGILTWAYGIYFIGDKKIEDTDYIMLPFF
jgi:hypothetical protein